jgi:subtilisin family serine protease
MKTTRRHLFLLTIVFFLIIHPVVFATAQAPPNVLPEVNGGTAVTKSDETGRYIIKFEDPPLTLYLGGIKGLSPTRPSSMGRTRLDSTSSASIAYRNHLEQRRKGIRVKMEQAIGRSLAFLHSYSVLLNGAVATLRPDEVNAVKKIPGIVDVQRDTLQFVNTDAGPDWISAPDLWTCGSGTYGEGIVIGVIDTGINPENPSFADIGGDGHDHTNPRGRFFGVCDPSHADYDGAFPCNDKLIGAYDFTPLVPEPENNETPWDVQGHGSHTAGTAAGNAVLPATATAPTTTLVRDISGVAPHANIISYRAIRSNGGGWLSVLVAAMEQAVIDGVDVINYSIGGSAANPWNDLDSETFLAARQAGVFVATSAGNSGPAPGSMGSPGNSPWLLTVGASTHNRRLNSTLSGLTRDGGGSLGSLLGKSLATGYGPARIVYAGDYPNANDDDGDPALCLEPYPAGTFTGEIVVCDRGDAGRVAKGENVLQGGAGGYVLANDAANDRSLSADAHVLPAVHIAYADGVALKDWLAAGSNHQATISGTIVDIDIAHADIMAAFSSRGENLPVPSIIKPDVTAPGVDIFAAGGIDGEVNWEVMSGTSMSSPHAAGAAALMIARHPLWTPAEIQSALMTSATATVLKEDEVLPADPFDVGTGPLDLFAADRAGVVLDESYDNFVAADPCGRW